MVRAVVPAIVMALALLAALPLRASAADLPPTITILEGEMTIIRGSNRFFAAEGVRLANADIVETADKTFAQIELPDRSVLQLGPGARAMLGAGGSARSFYMMTGWVKLSGANREPKAPGWSLRAPLFEIPANNAVVVFKATPGEVSMFVERGDVRIAERQSTTASTPVSLKANDFYRRKSGARGIVEGSPAQAFLGEMPRPFRDSLPSRIAKYEDNEVKPREGPDFAYADVELWLKGEPNLRRQFVSRWRGKAARDSAFRAALVKNLSSHFEWDPILFPEKYLPKDPPPPPAPQTQPPVPGTQPGATPATTPGR